MSYHHAERGDTASRHIHDADRLLVTSTQGNLECLEMEFMLTISRWHILEFIVYKLLLRSTPEINYWPYQQNPYTEKLPLNVSF